MPQEKAMEEGKIIWVPSKHVEDPDEVLAYFHPGSVLGIATITVSTAPVSEIQT